MKIELKEKKIEIVVSQQRTLKGEIVPTTFKFSLENNFSGKSQQEIVTNLVNRIARKLYNLDKVYRRNLTEFNKTEMERVRLLRNGDLVVFINGKFPAK